MKQWISKIKSVPAGWWAAAAVLLVLAVRWAKKISGLDDIGISGNYPAVPSMAVVLAVLSVIALSGILVYALRTKNFTVHRMYLICGLLVGSLYLLVFPPLSAPDEWAHYISAYKISNYLTGTPAVDENGDIMVQEDEMSEYLQELPDAGDYQYYWSNFLGKETSDVMVSCGNGGVNTFVGAYVPQALGITFARVLGLNYVSRIMFGRLFNLIFSVLAISLAIKWIPFGKKMMFGICMLPMTLHELASNSYDAWILAISMLFIAYCMKLSYEKEQVENRDVTILAVLIGLLAPCKIVYAPIIGLCLLIPKQKFGSTKRWFAAAGIVLGALVVMMLLVNAKVLFGYLNADVSDSHLSWAGEPSYTFGYFLENPMALVQIMLNTLNGGLTANYGVVSYFMTMLGFSLGHLDPNLQMPNLFFLIVVLLLGFSFLPAADEPKVLRKGNKWWMLFLVAVVVFLTMFSMLVGWTPISSGVILGVQGRYFLPILPLGAIVLFRDGNLVIKKDHQKLFCVAYAVFHVFLMAQMFGQVVSAGL